MCTAASILLSSLSAGMMATQMNSKVESGELDKFSIIQVEKLIVNTVQSRKYVYSTNPIYDCMYFPLNVFRRYCTLITHI